jgi:hypothetical protein
MEDLYSDSCGLPAGVCIERVGFDRMRIVTDYPFDMSKANPVDRDAVELLTTKSVMASCVQNARPVGLD